MPQNREKLFQEIIDKHRDKVYRICYAYLYDKNMVDDLYQEVLINLWDSLSSFQEKSKITTWLYRVTVNSAITFNRKDQKRRSFFKQDIPLQVPDSSADKVRKIEKEAKLNQLHRAINQLPNEEKIIVGLLLEDLSYQEIAEVMGISSNYVGVKINRAKKRLAKLMEANALN